MNLVEILKAQGISDEVIKAVQTEMKNNKIFTAGEENLDVRYGKLKAEHESLTQQYTEASGLIAELKKSTKGNEGLQQKITDYEGQVAQLQAELAQTKLDSAIRVELLTAKALDADYLTFKLKEKGELELDEHGKIKGWDDKLAALKTQFPTQFEQAGKKNIIENKLDPPDGEHTMTRAEILKKPYSERAKIFEENPEAFRQAMES